MSGHDVTVVGAGAAGMMAAIQAARRGARVLLLERNARPGVKLSITGKGRCNLTNDCAPEEFKLPPARPDGSGDPRFFRSALSGFTPRDTMAFFEELGVALVTERGRRVFPASGRAQDVVDALDRELHRLGAERRQARVTKLPGGTVIVCTGGLSYPKTGSTGDGYTLARQAGHTVVPPVPSLVPLESPDAFCAEMQGLSLRNVTLTLLDEAGRIVFTEGPGEMLFTHFGVSGPLVLSASAYWKPGVSARIDLKPGLDERQLDARILRDFEKFSSRVLSNALGELLHKTMIPVILSLLGAPPGRKVAEVTKAERAALLSAVKRFPVRLSGTRPVEEAVITRGGVNLKEINPKTMESKLVKGLFFAGEVLDLDGVTGGYNLQIAWSTGCAAGKGCTQ
ncbi:MAG: NAD(P)/FAD-dependent oxidoreductase [Oscillospiraceae bacterium]|jgi:predicted Rossmann fold flavoprotein|nr:NAD(P)/FAD-dependent oxidoreductase [Oscillospiraceae bacterium]